MAQLLFFLSWAALSFHDGVLRRLDQIHAERMTTKMSRSHFVNTPEYGSLLF